MDSHFQLTDEQLVNQFADCSLSPNLFNHEAHLRLAFIHLKNQGEAKAIENICTQIKAFDVTHGDGNKYNEIVTIAAVKIVNHFMGKIRSTTFDDFIKRFPQLVHAFKGLVNQHYSADIFNLPEAKNSYLEPDLIPFNNAQ